jgi:transcriptional regulator with XRE-family HTH domain
MDAPGELLKQEREAHGKTIEEMAEATGIRPHLLTALEQEAFSDLPGRGFGKLYIRAYAEVLGFDPRPVIEAYDQAVHGRQAAAPGSAPASVPRPVKAMLARWRQERIAARAESDVPAVEAPPEAPETIEGDAEAEPESAAMEQGIGSEVSEEPAVRRVPLPAEVVAPSRPARSRRWLMTSLLLLVLLPLMAYLVVFFSRSPDSPPVAARHEPVPRETIAPPDTQTPVREQTAPSSLKVAESGLGLRLVGTRLEGEGNRFRSGQRVTFETRVLGGGAGQSIRHVWLRDGNVEQSIRLRLGGASWRTYSTKTLGRPGAWSVEARDEQGRVLARADLTVAP